MNLITSQKGNNQSGKDRKTSSFKLIMLTFLLAIVLVGATGCSSKDKKDDASKVSSDADKDAKDEKDSEDTDSDDKDTKVTPAPTEAPTAAPTVAPETADIATEYTITNGNYTAGIDLPIGTCDIEYVSSSGFVSSSNVLDGGVADSFGKEADDVTSFKGQLMDKDVMLTVSGGVTVKLTYTEIVEGFTGREYDDANAVELTTGNYIIGKDIPAGIYNLDFVSGAGYVSSDNMFTGGIAEFIGEDDGSGLYSKTFANLLLEKDVQFSIDDAVTIRLTPAK